MVCVDIGVEHCKHPTWSRVGMEITPDELKKVLENKDYDASILEAWMPDLGCITLVLSLASLVLFLIYRRVTKRRSPGQGQWGLFNGKGDMQKLNKGFQLQEQVLLKMDNMEQRIAALEDFLRCMWRRRSMEKRSHNNNRDSDRKEALAFSDLSD